MSLWDIAGVLILVGFVIAILIGVALSYIGSKSKWPYDE